MQEDKWEDICSYWFWSVLGDFSKNEGIAGTIFLPQAPV